jgi:hypothetical protein
MSQEAPIPNIEQRIHREHIKNSLLKNRKPVDYAELTAEARMVGVYSTGATKRTNDFNQEIATLLNDLKNSGFTHYGIDTINPQFNLTNAQNLMQRFEDGSTPGSEHQHLINTIWGNDRFYIRENSQQFQHLIQAVIAGFKIKFLHRQAIGQESQKLPQQLRRTITRFRNPESVVASSILMQNPNNKIVVVSQWNQLVDNRRASLVNNGEMDEGNHQISMVEELHDIDRFKAMNIEIVGPHLHPNRQLLDNNIAREAWKAGLRDERFMVKSRDIFEIGDLSNPYVYEQPDYFVHIPNSLNQHQ